MLRRGGSQALACPAERMVDMACPHNCSVNHAWPIGFRTLALRPDRLHLDVLDSTVLYVEVLFCDDLKPKIAAAVP
jgi:hypothetical protein